MTWLQPDSDTLVLVDRDDNVVLRAHRYPSKHAACGFRWKCRYRGQTSETTDLDVLKAWAERLARRFHGSEAA